MIQEEIFKPRKQLKAPTKNENPGKQEKKQTKNHGHIHTRTQNQSSEQTLALGII